MAFMIWLLNYFAGVVEALFGIRIARATMPAVIASLSPAGKREIEGDAGLKRRAEILCTVMDNDGTLTYFGRKAVLMRMTLGVEERVQIKAILLKEPEIPKIKLVKPIIMINMPRTGSTVVHRLLHNDSRFICPLTWEMEHTHNLANPDAPTTCMFEQYFFPYERFKHIHIVLPGEVEEATAMCSRTLVAVDFPFLLDDYYSEYIFNMPREEHARVYQFMKSMIQIIIAHRGYSVKGTRVIVKYHASLLNLPAMLDVFPDGVVVMGHRDPIETVPSTCSLAWVYAEQFANGIIKPYWGLKMNWWMSVGGNQHVIQRLQILEERKKKNLPTENLFIDFAYKSIMKDPSGTLKDIYSRLEMPYTDESERAMTTYLANNKQHKHGRHQYTLQEYGLSAFDVKVAWHGYLEYFKDFL